MNKAQTNRMRKPRRGMMGFPGVPVASPQAAWLDALTTKVSSTAKRTIYIHIPFCQSRCSFCPFYFGKASESEFAAYIDDLACELETHAVVPGIQGEKINAVYFGGGTPSDMRPQDFERLLRILHNKYNLTNDCEITIEGRIKGFTDDKMQACVDNGVNRFSLGVQTFDTQIRQSIGRDATKKELIQALEKLISFNQAAVVIDLLYGLPGQSMEHWIEDQRLILEDLPISGCDHYALGLHPGLPLAQAIATGKMPERPDEELRFQMYKTGEEIMRNAGAVRLSLKHYALEYRERNANNDISGHKNICLPFGVHAGGRLGQYFFSQTNDLREYHELVANQLKPLATAKRMPEDYAVCGEIAGQVIRSLGFNLPAAAANTPAYSEKILEQCAPLIHKWQKDGLIYQGWKSWQRLSDRALFEHKTLIPELMDKIASAWPDRLI